MKRIIEKQGGKIWVESQEDVKTTFTSSSIQTKGCSGLTATKVKAKELKVPENVRLVFLPSSHPELNPVERLWEDMKGKVAFSNFKDEAELE